MVSLVVVGLLVPFLAVAPVRVLPAEASEPDASCRAGVSTTSNGTHTEGGITIEPVFSRRLYTDIGAGYNANYIAYRITNNTDASLTDLWVEVSGMQASSVVQLANPADAAQQIPTLASGAANAVTRYYLVRARGTSTGNERHTVRVFDGRPELAQQRAACFTDIEGVQRSIAANPNRVTAIAPRRLLRGAARSGQLARKVTETVAPTDFVIVDVSYIP